MESTRIVEAEVTVNLPKDVYLWDDDLIPVKDEDKLLGVAVPVTATRTKDTCVFKVYLDYQSEKGFEIITDSKKVIAVPLYSDGDYDYNSFIGLDLIYSR